MSKTYYAITKQTQENLPLYLTVKNIRGNYIAMFTGNKEFAYTFQSIPDAENFAQTYPWSEVPQYSITELTL